jgi:alpha-L-fucosidase
MTRFFALLLVLALVPLGQAAPEYSPTPENQAARKWFREAGFGMFIHWGVYSVPGRGEWVMNIEKIPIADYEKFAPQFNPEKFNAAEWVSVAKQAGMKYITITSKHHDGFAMFHTAKNKWNIVDGTPYGKDPLKMLAEECQRQGLKLFFYHSQLDWHHPDYYPRGRTGQSSGRPDSGDWNAYLDFMDAQLTELLTNYGPIAGIWFDGMWDKPEADWRLEKTYSLIHKLQPAALVGSNHHLTPFDGEDFQMFERDLPGQNEAGFSHDAKVSDLPLETCDTMNRSWGYNAGDSRYKSTAELIRYLARSAGYGANFLLNVGPRPDGTIQPEFIERLKEVGAWLGKYGESIYATDRGPIGPRPWGVTTQKGSKVYVHVLQQPDEVLALPALPKKVVKATLLQDGKPVEFESHRWGLLLKVPTSRRDPYDTVVVLETR